MMCVSCKNRVGKDDAQVIPSADNSYPIGTSIIIVKLTVICYKRERNWRTSWDSNPEYQSDALTNIPHRLHVAAMHESLS